MRRVSIISVLLLLLIAGSTFAKGYNIKVKIIGVKDTTVILAHYLSQSIYPDDTVQLDKSGVGVFKGNKELLHGMYIIYLPNKKYFEIFVDKDQDFEVINDTTAQIDKLSFVGSAPNTAFLDYQRFIMNLKKQRDALEDQMDSTDKKKNEKIKAQMEVLNDSVDSHQLRIINQNKDNIVGVFLNALRKIDVPDAPKDDKGRITDSTFQYKWYRNHYFDNFNYADGRLLRTPIYEDRLKQYLNNVIPQAPDSINREIDIILEQSRKDTNVFRFNLIKFFNYYAQSNIMGFDAVHVHLAEKYYIPEATWSDSAFITKLKIYVQEVKPTLIGNIAPDIELIYVPKQHFIDAANDTALKGYVYAGQKMMLSDVNAPFTVLVFWEKDCGHCRKVVPELYKVYEESLKAKGVVVVSFHLLANKEGKIKWIDFVNENKLLDWMNVWDPYTYKHKELYNVKSTPQIFLLDKDKRIIAKRVAPDQIAEIVDTMIRRDKKMTQQ